MRPLFTPRLPVLLLGLLLVFGTGTVLQAQEEEPPPEVEDPFEFLEVPDRYLPPGVGDEERAYAALEAARSRDFIRAGTLAREQLEDDRTNPAARAVLGMVLHRGEGALPQALYQLERARRDFETQWGPEPGDDEPWFWHAMIIGELAFVNGSMGRHEAKLALLAERDALYDPPWPADRAWPLMRLQRYDEARRAVEVALALVDQPDQIAAARTALCAIEAEQHRREAAYLACNRAAEEERAWPEGGPTPFTNAAESSLGMLRMDEAERWILEATRRFVYGTVSNPWLDLTSLYLGSGRVPEALDAVLKMVAWRHRQPPAMDEQNRAESEATSAAFLLVAGQPDHLERAVGITAKILDRPDRTGFTSSATEQLVAGAALLDRAANLAAAEVAAERRSWSRWRDVPGLLSLESARRFRAFTSSRRATALVADRRMLVSTIRPYLAGSIEIPEWLALDLVDVVGAGIIAAALEEARASENLPGAEGYFRAWDTEVAFARGDGEAGLSAARDALETLPGTEVLLRARVALRGSQAAQRLGDLGTALELLDRSLQLDRSTLRRLGAELPVVIEASQGEHTRRIASLLENSPRLRTRSGGFHIRLAERGAKVEACVDDPAGSRVACARTESRAGDENGDLERRLVEELHAALFAPRIDLTMADLQTLDGSPTAGGGRSAEKLHSVLDGLVGSD